MFEPAGEPDGRLDSRRRATRPFLNSRDDRLLRRILDRLAAVAAAFVVFGSSIAESATAPDQSRVLLANTSLATNVMLGPNGVPVLTLGLVTTLPISIDPAKVAVSIRRIDGRLLPWHAVAYQPGVARAIADEIPYAKLPTTAGATFQIEIDRRAALAWKGPAPSASDFAADERSHELQCPSCRVTAPATQTLLFTVPSAPEASPDLALRSLKRAFEARVAVVIRGAPNLGVPGSGPHFDGEDVPQPVGSRVHIKFIERDDVVGTSVGPLGVPAGAGLTAGTKRLVVHGILVYVDDVNYPYAKMAFASADEMRMYLRPGPRYTPSP